MDEADHLEYASLGSAKSLPSRSAVQPNPASGLVFLTEAQLEIRIPQAMDEKPEYVRMYTRQIENERVMASIGIQPRNLADSKEIDFELEQQIKQLKEMQRLKRAEEYKRFVEQQEQHRARKEQQELEFKQRQERRWQKMMSKVSFNLPSDEYYTSTPLQPGLGFFINLITHPRAKELQVNLPTSLFIKDKIYWVKYDQVHRRLKVITEFQPLDLYNSFKKKTVTKFPAIMRIPTDFCSFRPEVLEWDKLYDKIFKSQLPSSGIIQEYIVNASERPCTTRLLLVHDTRDNKSSCAFAMTNTDHALEAYHQGKYVLCSDQHDGIEVYPLFGQALSRVVAQGRMLLNFIHKYYFIRINEIVIDFVRDKQGNYWILNVKGFKLDESVTLARELRQQEEKELPIAAREELRRTKHEERLSSMTCKMCLLSYKNFEMDKVLPFKMLLLYKQHTHRSGRKTMELAHLRVLDMDFLSHWVRLCSVCYMLVIHEYELMETENLLAEYMNVPVKPADVMAKLDFKHPAFLPAELPQWRFMMYFQSLEFSILKLASVKNLYIHYSLFESTYSFALNSDWIQGATATFNIARLYYFFANLDRSVPKFCQTLLMPFRLTKGPEWEHVLASGVSNPLKDFTGEMIESSAIHQCFEIMLFRNDEQAVKLKFVAGLACDRFVKVKELPITITKLNGLYLPEESYFSSDPLPPQWIEIFDSNFSMNQSVELLESSQELDAIYSPLLSNNEMVSQPLCNTKILHSEIDLNPRSGLTSMRSLPSLHGQRSLHRGSSPLTVSSPRNEFSKPAQIATSDSEDFRNTASSPRFQLRPMTTTAAVPSAVPESSLSAAEPKSISDLVNSVNAFLLKSNIIDTLPISPRVSESSTEQIIPQPTLLTERSPQLTQRPTQTKLLKPIKFHSSKADRLDKQLEMISLYAAKDWKQLTQSAKNKHRRKWSKFDL